MHLFSWKAESRSYKYIDPHSIWLIHLGTFFSDQLIQESILKGEASESVKSMCDSVTQRHNEIMQIEKSVLEMHQMFLDMALVVEQQGEMLDCIEFQVGQSLEFIEEGNVEMGQAIQYQKNIWRRRMYCFLFLCLVVGLIVMVVKIRAGAGQS